MKYTICYFAVISTVEKCQFFAYIIKCSVKEAHVSHTTSHIKTFDESSEQIMCELNSTMKNHLYVIGVLN